MVDSSNNRNVTPTLLQVRLGQWQSFTGMEHGAPHARADHTAMDLVKRQRDVKPQVVAQ